MIYVRITAVPADSGSPAVRAIADFIFRDGDSWEAARSAGNRLRQLGWRPVAITDLREDGDLRRFSDAAGLKDLIDLAETLGSAHRIEKLAPQGRGDACVPFVYRRAG